MKFEVSKVVENKIFINVIEVIDFYLEYIVMLELMIVKSHTSNGLV